mmetsp:Transcript_97268/g.302877  ORF Transcript_97268/g.302877 Transcript_97268/m.302877 type:complete len:253 (+) Transcript_97268:197-955(+)
MVVGLEHHLADAGARQPLGLEPLDLPKVLHLVRLAGGGALHVQGEERLPALGHADAEGERQVLQVDGRGGIGGGEDAELGVLQHQAAHALGDLLAGQHAVQVEVAGDQLLPPADVVLRALLLLQVRVAALTGLLVLLGLAQHQLGLALAVQEGLLAAGGVAKVADGEAALRAQPQLLAIGVARHVQLARLLLDEVPPGGPGCLLASLRGELQGIEVRRRARAAGSPSVAAGHRHVHRAHRCHCEVNAGGWCG